MPDNVKVSITERNGVELGYPEELPLIPSNIPFSDLLYVSDNVEDAIIESATTGGQSRYVATAGYESTVQNGRYMEFHRGNSSDEYPHVFTETNQMISMSVVVPANVGVNTTIELKINTITVESITILAGNSKATKTFTTPVTVVDEDELSIVKTAGTNTAGMNVYVNIKVPF